MGTSALATQASAPPRPQPPAAAPESALSRLDPRHHRALSMRLEGKSWEAIAEAIGVARRSLYEWRQREDWRAAEQELVELGVRGLRTKAVYAAERVLDGKGRFGQGPLAAKLLGLGEGVPAVAIQVNVQVAPPPGAEGGEADGAGD